MRKNRGATLCFLVAVSLWMAPLSAAAEDVGIAPELLDFGVVEVGESITLPLVITSLGPTPLNISTVYVSEDSGGVFELTDIDSIPPELDPGESIVAEVTFTPSAEGAFAGILTIVSNDRETPVLDVAIIGNGIEGASDPTARELLDALIAFFEAAVDDGDIVGIGPNDRARRARLRAVSHKLDLASDMLDSGRANVVCRALDWLERHSDGVCRPTDTIEGPLTDEFHDLVVELFDALECS